MTTLRELVSYGAIGAASNAALFVLYLALTSIGVGHKTAMTLLFVTGMTATFLLNRRWTFRHRGRLHDSSRRYLVAYSLAYVGNIVALALLVDMAGLPHAVVMAFLIVATACFLFVLQKVWVFPKATAHRPERTVVGG
jgi:putative flippase GtrA